MRTTAPSGPFSYLGLNSEGIVNNISSRSNTLEYVSILANTTAPILIKIICAGVEPGFGTLSVFIFNTDVLDKFCNIWK